MQTHHLRPPLPAQATSIQEVIDTLKDLIDWATTHNHPLGYFPALYCVVTAKVKEGIEAGSFEDNVRMEKLDVVFANRYFQAFEDYYSGQPTTAVWQTAFDAVEANKLLALQHILLGINAHISLDLGIAAAQIAPGPAIQGLKNDFQEINVILNGLIQEVQDILSEQFFFWRIVDILGGNLDELFAALSIRAGRMAAWQVAREMAALPPSEHPQFIETVDQEVLNISTFIQKPRSKFLAFMLRILQVIEPHRPKKVLPLFKDLGRN